ncbi:MAG: stage II sporulation protein P [Christensenellales bacterium]
MREKDKSALYLIAFAALALVTLISWDRLKTAFFSPGGIMLRALPSAEAYDSEYELGGNTIRFDVLEIDEDVDRGILFELLDSTGESDLSFSGEGPSVLIYHTHTTESYLHAMETDWRTRDEQQNIVAIGKELARILTEEYGISVIHDTTNHEPPRLGTSYERSLKTMEYYKDKYPGIRLFIDVHRDSYELKASATMEDYIAVNDVAVINGKKCARIMFVVGTGEGKTGQGFAVKPNYKRNYNIALHITNFLNDIHPKLTRPIRVYTGRYNQHVGDSVLVEVGHNANTLEEALNSLPYLAAAIASLGGGDG